MLGGVVLAVLAVAGVVAWLTTDGGGPRGAHVPIEGDVFAADGTIAPGPFRGGWSPDGGHLLTISAQGVGEARRGRVRLLTAPGSRAVDAAWFPGSNAVLVAEGPVPTGELAVLGLDGRSLGRVPLNPSFGVGTGRGMTIDRAGQRAVVTLVDRDPFRPTTRTDLALVDMKTGADHPLVPTADTDEDRPFFIGPDTVAFTSKPASGGPATVVSLDIDTGSLRVLSPKGEDAVGIGAIDDGAWVAYTSGSTLWAVPSTGGTPFRLARVPSGAAVVAVHPDGDEALVVEPEPGGASRLRRLTIRSLPSAGGPGEEGYGGSPWRSTFS
jgi:hypothetical protein